MVTTNYVVVETCALLQSRIGIAPVRDFEEKILPLLHVHFVDASLHGAAMHRLFRTDRRRLSLVDAVSFEVMDSEGITDVLGLDSDFEVAGFHLVS
jgi:predicted nucleic acid-binding protein